MVVLVRSHPPSVVKLMMISSVVSNLAIFQTLFQLSGLIIHNLLIQFWLQTWWCWVKYGKYFPNFLYFATYFSEIIYFEWNNRKIWERRKIFTTIVEMQNIFNLIACNSVHISDIFNWYDTNINGIWNTRMLGEITLEFTLI